MGSALIELSCSDDGLTPFLGSWPIKALPLTSDADAAGVRKVVRPPYRKLLVAVSFSKNLGLYRERTVGALLSIERESSERADVPCESHVRCRSRAAFIRCRPITAPRSQHCIFNDVELLAPSLGLTELDGDASPACTDMRVVARANICVMPHGDTSASTFIELAAWHVLAARVSSATGRRTLARAAPHLHDALTAA